MILVAHSTDDDRLYAVERIQDGIYALCILGSWVGLKTLEQLRADGQNHESMFFRQHAKQIRPWEREWWRATTIEPDYGINASSETSPGAEKIRDVRLCLQRPVPSETRSTTAKEKSLAHLEPVQTETALNTMAGEASQRPEEVLETIKAQYLEALYASKVGFVCCRLLDVVANITPRHPWHTSQKVLFLELELPIVPVTDLRTIHQI